MEIISAQIWTFRFEGGGFDTEGMVEQVIDDVPNDFTCHCHCYNLVNLISI